MRHAVSKYYASDTVVMSEITSPNRPWKPPPCMLIALQGIRYTIAPLFRYHLAYDFPGLQTDMTVRTAANVHSSLPSTAARRVHSPVYAHNTHDIRVLAC